MATSETSQLKHTADCGSCLFATISALNLITLQPPFRKGKSMVVGLPSTDVNMISFIAGGICRLFFGANSTCIGKVIFVSLSPSILLSYEALFSKSMLISARDLP